MFISYEEKALIYRNLKKVGDILENMVKKERRQEEDLERIVGLIEKSATVTLALIERVEALEAGQTTNNRLA
jgi:hypothetical protein